MIRRDTALFLVAISSASCATVVDEGVPSESSEMGDGDEVASGDGDADSVGDGDATGDGDGSGGVLTTGSGGSASTTGGSTSTGGMTGDGDTVSGGSSSGGSGSGGDAGNPSGTVLFSDDFEAGTDQWTWDVEGWSTTTDGSTVLTQTILDSELRVAYAGEAWGDVIIEGRMKILEFEGSGGSYYAGLMIRTVDSQNGYILAFQSNTDLKIKQINGGSDNSLSSSASNFDVQTGVWYQIRFQIIGNSMTAFVDGQPLLTVAHTSYPAGMIGVATDRATAVFDDIVVTTP